MRKEWEDKINKNENIEVSVPTYNQAYDIIQILKPYNYELSSCCTYSGVKPNMIFKYNNRCSTKQNSYSYSNKEI